MKVELLQEPELQFGAGRHVDIRFGLRNYGPITFDDPLAPKEIRLGLVGTSVTIEGVKEWLANCRGGLAAKASKKPNLFPSFPGFGSETCFKCDWVSSEKLEASIHNREIEAIIKTCSRTEGIPKLVDLFIKEAQRLCEKGVVDVIVCAPPKELLEFVDEGPTSVSEEDVDESRDEQDDDEEPVFGTDFHDMLKAKGLSLAKPIQMVRPATYDETVTVTTFRGQVRRVQDPATRAWNFHTALYYKAGGTPWRLARSPSEYQSCFIGISFYRSRDKQRVFTSVAQVFNERGEGMILRGGEAKKSEDDRQTHLEREDISALIHRSLTAFHQEHRHWPARVVVHKTSLFNQQEILGCDDALSKLGIASRDLVTVSDSFIRLFRQGLYPPLRGTLWSLDDKQSILYTRGSIDFYQVYPGMYVPRTLSIVSADVEQSARSLAREILALTKMNWNNTQFDAAYPITIKAARQVGGILKYLDSDSRIQAGYAFYM
ncbi:MAG: hypothetical protein HS117_06245 [Verrucomicrobiaceae bacterium]|nr:hypothetical protein [Verrucomicrobiaceae bacterium]